MNSFNNVLNNCTSTVGDDRRQLLTWLSLLEPNCRHCDIRESRINSDPKRLARPALGTAGLIQAFSGTAGPGCGIRLSKTKAGSGLDHLQALGISTLTLISKKKLSRNFGQG